MFGLTLRHVAIFHVHDTYHEKCGKKGEKREGEGEGGQGTHTPLKSRETIAYNDSN